MFEVAEVFMVQFINIMPFLIPFILVMNLIYAMLWGGK